MKENKKDQAKKGKDYYSSVLFSQIICCGLVVALFFALKGSSHWTELQKDYSALLHDVFLSKEISSAVSAVKDYLVDEKSSYAVFGSRVEPYQETTAITSETTTAESTEQETVPVFASETVSEMALTYERETTAQPLVLTKPQNIIFPVEEGRYTSFFGERTDPISEGDDYHKGLDIGADAGDKIRAVFDGTVSSVGYDSRSGNYIFLTHPNGYVTFYCHCSEILAKEGTVIRQGETIALVGSTGYSTGPHLHFELRVDGESVDPLPLLEDAV